MILASHEHTYLGYDEYVSCFSNLQTAIDVLLTQGNKEYFNTDVFFAVAHTTIWGSDGIANSPDNKLFYPKSPKTMIALIITVTSVSLLLSSQ